MSPKKITQTATVIGLVSLVGALLMAIFQPGWGLWSWWPAMGLALTLLLLVIAFMWGAYLSAQKRAEMVDLLNDCYTGNTPGSDSKTSAAH